MEWSPLSEETLWDYLDLAEARMQDRENRLWNLIRVQPEKWDLPLWGEPGDGFWVVAVIGTLVIWYNDIEEGFNCSAYSRYGIIDEYHCSQDTLETALSNLLRHLDTGASIPFQAPPWDVRMPGDAPETAPDGSEAMAASERTAAGPTCLPDDTVER